jgi:hypothetical protein
MSRYFLIAIAIGLIIVTALSGWLVFIRPQPQAAAVLAMKSETRGAGEHLPRRPLFSSLTKEKPMSIEGDTGNLIASNKVDGTAVYGANDEKIGSIAFVMIEKISGKVSYAVLGFGGILGIGDDHYPLPWHSLKYDTGLGGYRTSVTVDQLKGAPKYGAESGWDWSDPSRSKAVDDYYSL